MLRNPTTPTLYLKKRCIVRLPSSVSHATLTMITPSPKSLTSPSTSNLTLSPIASSGIVTGSTISPFSSSSAPWTTSPSRYRPFGDCTSHIIRTPLTGPFREVLARSRESETVDPSVVEGYGAGYECVGEKTGSGSVGATGSAGSGDAGGAGSSAGKRSVEGRRCRLVMSCLSYRGA